jgi:hypothetical protein
MKMQKRHILFSLITLFVFVFSLVSPTVALADDGAPPPEAPLVVETQVSDQSGTESTDTAAAPEAPVSLPEVLEQAPEGTTVVVVNDAGQVEPLVTTEAAVILQTGDPIWCPGTQAPTPGANGCTPSNGTMAALITELGTGAYAGNGIIWVESSYSGADNSEITFDQTDSLNDLTALNDLTFQGGWSGTGGDTTIGTAPVFDVPLNILNWIGNITLNNLSITANDTYAALVVDTTGNITVDDVLVNGNTTGSGAYLDSCQYNGGTGLCAGTGAIAVTNSQFNNNHSNGLVTDSAGNTTLNNVQASQTNPPYGDGLNGAVITGADDDGTGNVTITNSTFSNNTNGTGVDVLSDGNVTLTNVTANGNNTGALLDTTPGTGNILVDGGQFDSNDYDGLDAYSAGNITITNNADISSNLVDGAYLDATYGIGDISVTNSTFTGNNMRGIKAITSEGNITLSGVNVAGTNVTDIGAWAKAINGGNVSVQNSTFTNTTQTGLIAVSGVQVDLVSLTVTGNAGNGVEVYSTYTYACFGSTGILVNVDNGTYASNGFTGIFAKPGPDGTVNVITPPTFTPVNGTGDLVIDLSDPCQGKEEEKPDEGNGLNVVDVPFKGGEPVAQDCFNYSSTILRLPNGTWVKFGCPFEGFTVLEGLNEDELPDSLGAGADFVAGISYGMTDLENAVVTFNKDGTITITFQIPEDSHARSYDILYWDPAANNGAGAWVTLPQSKFGQGLTPLNPNDPADGRMIKRGVKQKGDTVTVTVNFTGIFVLVAR